MPRVTAATGLRAAGPGLRDDGGVSSESDPRASTESGDTSASVGAEETSASDRSAVAAGDPAPGGGDGGPDPAGSGAATSTDADAAPTGGTPRPRPRIGPRPMQKPGRTETRMKDMLGALLILIPIALLLVGVTRSCTFAPAGPTIDPNAGPTVDAPARLGEYAKISTFPLRVPAVGWRANSTDRGEVVGGGTAVRVGFVTGEGRYLRLVQSDATEENLLRTEAGTDVPTGEGVTPAAGLNWVTYRSGSGEPFRVTAVPTPGSPTPTRLLITGSGNDDEFRTLAEATIRARPPPTGGGTN
ncbi:uncharacterized protein DUF4245 [Pseudonocardia sediminis]|uniref:Uncharacterized protein DUF4245 n=1 Tax=Pseudonocardia sediminis TaxID=1397368 RepID=A0A4Q7UQI4_PSEST|nr:DUF4245 domain-containing protein [Pseudonocardia sediminis]RZT84002.1 uncharacterized protein DUF4245 [Pseudonocardia sediminis]